MKMLFVMESISGAAMSARFATAIDEEGVGYDPDFDSSARLSADGRTWVTALSGFRYTILNPESKDPAIIEYIGGFRGFLAQNLIPDELRGETTRAEVVEGSALGKHGVPKLQHAEAALLAEAYGLMQAAAKGHIGGREDVFAACVAAVEAAREISAHMSEIGVERDSSWCRAGNGSSPVGSLRLDKDPSVFVTCCPGGRQVAVEFPFSIDPLYIEQDRREIVEQAKAWLDRLRPTFDPAP